MEKAHNVAVGSFCGVRHCPKFVGIFTQFSQSLPQFLGVFMQLCP